MKNFTHSWQLGGGKVEFDIPLSGAWFYFEDYYLAFVSIHHEPQKRLVWAEIVFEQLLAEGMAM